jgi:hypothetical protein
MLVQDCKPGDVIRMIHSCGTIGESIYRIASPIQAVPSIDGENIRVKAWRNHSQGSIYLFGPNECVVLSEQELSVLDLSF